MIRVGCDDYELDIDPVRGGAILRFVWQGEPLMREAIGPGILEAACFPLVPWSNRIAQGRGEWEGRRISLMANCPEADPVHPLHGLGWQAPWRVAEAGEGLAVLEFQHEGGDWPWPFRAIQRFELTGQGLELTLSVANTGDGPMPAGLGLHPYFPRTPGTAYRGLHRGRWHNSPDCLPLRLEESELPCDWWQGEPVGTLPLDTVFSGRHGPLRIEWPDRGLGLIMTPSARLDHTAVYVPDGADWFCVEPVSHMTDALNSSRPDCGIERLDPGGTLTVSIGFHANRL